MPSEDSYYMEGLRRQANANYARTYLGIQNAAGQNLLTDFGTSPIYCGYVVNRTALWQDIRIPLASTRAGAAAPTASAFQPTGTGNLRAWRWNSAAPEASLEWELQLPHGFFEGATYGIRLHIHWTAGSITSPNTVGWGVEVSLANLNGVFSAPAIYTATGATTVAWQHVVTPVRTFTGLTDSAVLVGRLFRDTTDSYAGNDVFGLSLDIHFAVEKAGSTDEYGD